MIMKNREKFAKEIMDIACSGYSIAFDKKANKLTKCNNTPCGKCAFYSSISSCRNKRKEWCESEYKEQGVDWSKVPVDTPVLVRDSTSYAWNRHYFAYYKDDIVHTYSAGATSWSANKNSVNPGWNYAKLANEEDISKYPKENDRE